LKEENKKFEKALEIAREVEEKLAGLERDLNQLSDEDRHALAQMIPTSFDQLRTLNDIEGIAALHGVKVASVKVTEKDANKNNNSNDGKNENSYESETIDLSVESDYAPFVDFLLDLEKNLQLFDITAIELAGSEGEDDDGSDSGKYTFDITLQTYWINI